MAEKIIMPKQGLQMTEGTIIRWMAQEGEQVREGEPLFEMETDKLTIDIDSTATGTLLKILHPAGDVVPITETIAWVGEPGEAIPEEETAPAPAAAQQPQEEEAPVASAAPAAAQRAPGERVFVTPRARTRAEERGIDPEGLNGSGPEGLIIERDVLAANQVLATPLARKVAQDLGVDLGAVEGSGARGKVRRADLDGLVPPAAAAEPQGDRLVPFAGMRKVIADNMMRSLHSMAQANHRMKVDMTEVIRWREQLKASGVKVSFTDIMTRVVAVALMDSPMNASLTDEGLLLHGSANIGIAVAVDNGLIVPVIRNAEQLSVQQIAQESARLVDSARQGKLRPDEYKGGTFTITNLGMYDVDEFTAVINPPEAGILAMGKIDRVPVVEGEDRIVIKPITMLSLTYDHRIVDGAPAAQFLQRIKQLLQNPYLLL